MQRVLLVFTLCIALGACKKKANIQASFYYWKTHFSLSTTEKKTLSDLNASSLYVRLFDVDIPEGAEDPLPVGVTTGLDSVLSALTIVPVVFITNRTFLHLTKKQVQTLASQVLSKINSIRTNYDELQFDCDWSPATKENYFLFLEEVKRYMSAEVVVSCTIRLHQIKYAYKTGVPPVKKGMLMFYNMGDLHNVQNKNSIFNTEDAEKYIDHLDSYQLPLDIALPIFRWYVHYRNNAVIGLITKRNQPFITDPVSFSRLENSTIFNVKKDHLENGVFYRTGDQLRLEALNGAELQEAAELLSSKLRPQDRTILFYDLDEDNIKQYDQKIFKNILAEFN